MSIVHDYAAIGARYHQITDGWLPKLVEPASIPEPVPEPSDAFQDYRDLGTALSAGNADDMRSIVDRIRSRKVL